MVGARITSFLKEHGWVLNLLFIFLGAYFVAGAANAVVARSIREVPSIDDAPARSKRTHAEPGMVRPQLTAIAERNLMGAKREVIVPPVATEEATLASMAQYNPNDLKPCTIPHSVRATLVAENAPEWSMAVIVNNTDQEPQVYSINEGHNQIGDDMFVYDIRNRAVVVRRRDHYELCACDGDGVQAKPALAAASTETPVEEGDSGGVAQVSESQYTVARTEVDNALSNLSQVATQARIVPSFKNGKPNGFKLFSIKPGSIYSKIGLKNGDVIQKINGYEINSPDKALELYQKLKDASSVAIELQRRGQTQSFNYSIQ